MSPEWRSTQVLGPRKCVPEKRCPFNSGNKFKDYVEVFFPGPNFVSPEWRCPMNRGLLKEKFHYNHVQQSTRNAYRQQQVAPVVSYEAFLFLGIFFFFFFFYKRIRRNFDMQKSK